MREHGTSTTKPSRRPRPLCNLKQEDPMFEARLGNLARLVVKIKVRGGLEKISQEHQLLFQHPQGNLGSQLPVTPASGNQRPFSGPLGNQTQTCYTGIQNTHDIKIRI